MTEMANDQEKRLKQLKRNLESWREVILPLNSLLTWEEKWYPGAVIGIITTAFLLVWWLDPAVLTLFSVLALLGVLVDYLVPTITSSFCRADSWTGAKEKRLEEVCRGLVSAETCLLSMWTGVNAWRHARPKLYYAVMLSILLCAAYIGSIINNMLLTYLIVLLSALTPGVRRHGLLKRQLAQISCAIAGMIGQPTSPETVPSTSDKSKKN